MPTPHDIDALLPQTQCGLCGYGGCLPYAAALANQEAPIHLCPPGGVETLLALGNLLSIDAAPYLTEMEQKTKAPMLAVIREKECIGCTKCIKACPVDAIIGSAKQMHTILNDLCTGCELCVPACPVDCIDMIKPPDGIHPLDPKKRDSARTRYLAREVRVNHKKAKNNASLQLQEKKDFIRAAILRAKQKVKK